MSVFKRPFIKDDGGFDFVAILVKMGAILIAFGVLVFIIYSRYGEKVDEIGYFITHKMGMPGIALFAFINSAFIILPITVDVIFPFLEASTRVQAFWVLGIFGAIGGWAGYWIGRLIRTLPIVDSVVKRLPENIDVMLERYGTLGVAICGLLPLPFSAVCWAAGILKLNPWKTLLATSTRIIRVFAYYFIIYGAISLVR